MKPATRDAQLAGGYGERGPAGELWRIDWKKYGYGYCGIYIISPDNRWPCKIGISQNPSKRLVGLQTACWRRLDIAEYRFVENSVVARAIEAKCHATLTEEGKLMNGEWFDIRPDKAVEVVDFAAAMLGIDSRKDIPDERIRETLTEFAVYHKNSPARKLAESTWGDC